jgi:hypothetical protein
VEPFFSWRKISARDLPVCLKLHPAKNGAEDVGLPIATVAWLELLNMTHASRGAVVELNSYENVEIVGFGFAAFVRKSFIDAELLAPKPGLNCRVINSIALGHSVIATYDEVRAANTLGELQQVILDTSWKSDGLTAAQRDEVRVLLGMAYQELFSGYGFSRIVTELVDELDLWHIEGHRSFQIVNRFEAYQHNNPKNIWNSNRALAVVTAETMRQDPHSVAAGLFHHRPQPQFSFTRGEQQLLELALEGLDDATVAKSLFVGIPAIKRRWEKIFACVAVVRPDLCPPGGDGTRGVQKRQRVVTYVRNHPEELRPFNSTSATISGGLGSKSQTDSLSCPLRR